MILLLTENVIAMGSVLCYPRQCGETQLSTGGMAGLPCATETHSSDHCLQWGRRDHVILHVLAAGAQQTYSWRICSFLCFAIPLLYGMNKSERKLPALSICFMYREESNQRSRIQIASANAFDLRRYTITQERGAGTPLTLFNATVAVCPAGI